MFNIDLESKLNNLNEGTYYKTLNGKSYEIKVKNIEDNKIINVYFNKMLIVSLEYNKDGLIKKVENIEKVDDKELTLSDIIEKMIDLSEGYAEYNNMNIRVKESKQIDNNSSTSFKVEIEDEEYSYVFTIPFVNEFYINIKSKNNNLEYYTFKNSVSSEKDNRNVVFVNNDKKYNINSKGNIKDINDNKEYLINDNTLLYSIDDKHYIGYSFETNKVYLYTKKCNALKNDIEIDYYKTLYNKNIAKASNICNNILSSMKNKIKEKIDDKELNNLVDNVKIPEVNNYDIYYDKIIQIAELYKNNIKYLNILDDKSVIDRIMSLINNANITIVDQKVNDFKDSVKYNNLKDLNALYDLKSQIKEIIKLKKKQNRTKKKILKNTDIEN